MPRNLSQVRADRAFGILAGNDKPTRDVARDLGSVLRQNGLLAAFAFLLKKGGRHEVVLGSLCEHLLAALPGDAGGAAAPDALFRRWVGAQQGLGGPALRRLTAEAIAYAEWLKRAAQALDEG